MTIVRPEVHLCLASSLDGRIAQGAGEMPAFTSRFDRHKLFDLRAQSDALLIGAGTVRTEQFPPLIYNDAISKARQQRGQKPNPPAVIVSRSLQLPWDSGYFNRPEQEVMVLCAEATAAQKKTMAGHAVRCLETGPAFSLSAGLQQLAKMGCRRILAEGGGQLVRALLAEDLVDVFHLTIAPTVIGGESTPLLCHGPALVPRAEFVLASVHQYKHELHLMYERPPGAATL